MPSDALTKFILKDISDNLYQNYHDWTMLTMYKLLVLTSKSPKDNAILCDCFHYSGQYHFECIEYWYLICRHSKFDSFLAFFKGSLTNFYLLLNNTFSAFHVFISCVKKSKCLNLFLSWFLEVFVAKVVVCAKPSKRNLCQFFKSNVNINRCCVIIRAYLLQLCNYRNFICKIACQTTISSLTTLLTYHHYSFTDFWEIWHRTVLMELTELMWTNVILVSFLKHMPSR